MLQMKRKDVSINKIYDTRALRVIVGDKNGTLHGPAVQCCYSLLNTVHKYIQVTYFYIRLNQNNYHRHCRCFFN